MNHNIPLPAPSSSNELHARAMTFASAEHRSGAERERIFSVAKELGEVALHELFPGYADASANEHFKSEVAKRAELQDVYDSQFAAEIQELKRSITPYAAHEHDTYLASGTQANVFTMTHDGKDYVVRTLKSGVSDPVKIDGYAAATLPVQGLPHFEQVVAVSYNDEVTVAERMPGDDMSRLTSEAVAAIPEEQVGEFISTLKTAHDKQLVLDHTPNNVMYDSAAGFGLIDFAPPTPGEYRETSFGDTLASFADMFQRVGENAVHHDAATARDRQDYYDEKRALAQARMLLIQKYSHQIEQAQLSDADRQTALRKTRMIEELLQQEVDRLNDPEWVAREMEQATQYYGSARKMGAEAVAAAGGTTSSGEVQHTWEVPTGTMTF